MHVTMLLHVKLSHVLLPSGSLVLGLGPTSPRPARQLGGLNSS